MMSLEPKTLIEILKKNNFIHKYKINYILEDEMSKIIKMKMAKKLMIS